MRVFTEVAATQEDVTDEAGGNLLVLSIIIENSNNF